MRSSAKPWASSGGECGGRNGSAGDAGGRLQPAKSTRACTSAQRMWKRRERMVSSLENSLKTFACAGKLVWHGRSQNNRGKAGKVVPRGCLLVLQVVSQAMPWVATGPDRLGGGLAEPPGWVSGACLGVCLFVLLSRGNDGFLDCISLAREEKRCEGRGRQEPAQGERWPRCAKPGFGVGAMSAAWPGALRLPK